MQNNSSSTRLWLAIRLPDLPWQAQSLPLHDDQAFIVTEKKAATKKQVVIWANAIAIAQGVSLGMDETTAQLLSGSVVKPRNLAQESRILANLSAELYQFTPYIETYVSDRLPQAGLLLEVSSCLLLFGGIKTLSEKIEKYLGEKHFSFSLGLAHSAKGAWLLSFVVYAIQGDENTILFVDRLKKLPIQLLYDYPKQVDVLEKTGFVTLSDIAQQIYVQSISSIKKRFGQDFSQTICDIFGIEHDFQQNALFEKPVNLYKPSEFFEASIQFDYPIHYIEQLQSSIECLLQKMTQYLRKRQLETQHIEWVLSDIYHNKDQLQVYADSGQSHWQLWFDLTLIQLENRDLPFEVDALELRCRDTLPLQNTTSLLNFDVTRKTAGQSFTLTAAKLKARLGDASVFKLSYCDSHIPEISNKTIALNETSHQQLPDVHRTALRPHWLFKTPVALEERKQGLYWRGYLKLLVGPERIQGNWWQKPTARDYFLAQRHDHVRLWVFWDLHKKNWYVQGVFG
jgi:protein ImuB